MTQSRYHLHMPEALPAKRPARRSWVDILIAWIERLPGPAWVFYLAVSAFFAAGDVGLRWLDGSQKVGTIDPVVFVFAVLSIYGLAAVHFLTGAARRSLAAFRPALGALDSEYDALERRLTTMSPLSAIIAVVIAIVIQAVGASTSATGWGITAKTSFATNIFTVFQEVVFGTFIVVFLVRGIRQLRLIVWLHREATKINLYDVEPHIAFSRFTFPASVSVTVPYALAEVLAGFAAGISPFEIVLLVSTIAISFAIFILPLNGMHRRLVLEKRHAIRDSDRRFELAATKLHEQLDVDALDQMDALNKALSSLVIESERLKRISTWPWRADTLRGFLTSIALPIVLWLITTLLGRFIFA
jgi:hypothetical protein